MSFGAKLIKMQSSQVEVMRLNSCMPMQARTRTWLPIFFLVCAWLWRIISHSFLLHFEWTKACFDPHARNYWCVPRGQGMHEPFVRNLKKKKVTQSWFLDSLILCIFQVCFVQVCSSQQARDRSSQLACISCHKKLNIFEHILLTHISCTF